MARGIQRRLLHHRADINIIHHARLTPEGSATPHKLPGREETEFIRSKDMWWRPIEVRVGPDGAMYVADFYNQAVIHNDTRGPDHNKSTPPCAPDRDHYFGRIWRIDHKEATGLDLPVLNRADLDGLIRVMRTSPNAHTKRTAWRLAQENHPADPRLAQVAPSMGSKAVETYERARVATTATARQAVLESFAASTDNWTRSALVAAATEQAPAYVVEALAHSRPQMLTDFVAAVLPTALPAHASRLLVAAAGAGPGAGALKASIVRAVARVPGFGSVSEAQTTRALETLLDENPETRAGAFAVVAKHARLRGVLGGKADRSAPLILQDLRSHSVSDDRRIDSAAALLAVPGPARAQALSTIAPMLSDPATASPLKSRLIVALGESAGPDVDAVLVTALSRANSAPLFDAIVKRPETALALLAAMQDRTVAAATLSPANVARLRSHPNREVATKAAALFDALSAAAKTKTDIIAALLPDVEKPGDAAKGRALFTGACSGCPSRSGPWAAARSARHSMASARIPVRNCWGRSSIRIAKWTPASGSGTSSAPGRVRRSPASSRPRMP